VAFKVINQSAAHHFIVEQNETVLDAALRQAHILPYGCRNGSCGDCKGRLVEGDIDIEDYDLKALSADERESGLVLFCRAIPRSDLVIDVNEMSSGTVMPIKKMPARIAKMEQLAHDIMRLYLTIPSGLRFQFLAGQYIQVIMRDGKKRSFSIASSPDNDEFIELHIRNIEGGVFSDMVFSHLKEKSLLRLEGPYGQYALCENSQRPLLFVAGGTGFAPIKSIIEHALAETAQRSIRLFWGARAQRDLYLDELPRGWGQQSEFIYTPVLSEPMPEDNWQGETGYVHEVVLREAGDLSVYDIYASGPPAMVHAAHDAFTARGMAPKHFYSDAFEYAKD